MNLLGHGYNEFGQLGPDLPSFVDNYVSLQASRVVWAGFSQVLYKEGRTLLRGLGHQVYKEDTRLDKLSAKRLLSGFGDLSLQGVVDSDGQVWIVESNGGSTSETGLKLVHELLKYHVTGSTQDARGCIYLSLEEGGVLVFPSLASLGSGHDGTRLFEEHEFVQIESGNSHFAGLTRDANLLAHGSNLYGQLGSSCADEGLLDTQVTAFACCQRATVICKGDQVQILGILKDQQQHAESELWIPNLSKVAESKDGILAVAGGRAVAVKNNDAVLELGRANGLYSTLWNEFVWNH